MKSSFTAVGVDIIEIKRIELATQRWHDSFLRRIYTEAELQHCRSRYASLAARFAAKEAVMKSLVTGVKGWHEIEILNDENNAPYVKLHGGALHRAEELGIAAFSVSLSHCEKYAIALSVSNAA